MIDLELQRWLASQLSELIERVPFAMDGDEECEECFHWKNGNQNEIPPESWDHVVRMVESKLTDEQQADYIRILCGVDEAFDRVNKIDPMRFNNREEYVKNHLARIGWDEVWCYAIRAEAKQRTRALKEVLK